VLYGAYAHFQSWVQNREQVAAFVAATDANWGNGASLGIFAPGMLSDTRFRTWWAKFERLGATPAAAIALARMNAEIDVRACLPRLAVPTLVIHRRDDVHVKVAAGRYLASHIAEAVMSKFPAGIIRSGLVTPIGSSMKSRRSSPASVLHLALSVCWPP
jgi:pimeloyl-ACP methyl ester carboxylesterase